MEAPDSPSVPEPTLVLAGAVPRLGIQSKGDRESEIGSAPFSYRVRAGTLLGTRRRSIFAMAQVLLIGGGGREHALAWKLAQSEAISQIFVAPGNPGIAGEPKCVCVSDLIPSDHEGVVSFCKDRNVSLVIVGPEAPLAGGLADALIAAEIQCFGPRAAAAKIESDKEFAKSFMNTNGIPTPNWQAFSDGATAKEFIALAPYDALVVKAVGLAAGKGVIVASTKEGAYEAVDELMANFGSASDRIIVEEKMSGEEVSLMAFCDGESYKLIPVSQDHKRLLDGDQGPNTGGMGAVAPVRPLPGSWTLEELDEKIMKVAVEGMKKAGVPFVGVLYAGLMMTKKGPMVLEFNCRFGDPEAEVVLPLLESDLLEVVKACVDGKLGDMEVKWNTETNVVGTVVISEGYPGAFKSGHEIKGLEVAQKTPALKVFHAGTRLSNDNSNGDESRILTNGGRVLCVVGYGTSLSLAMEKSTSGAMLLSFPGSNFRRDIGHRCLLRSILVHGELSYAGAGVSIERSDAFVSSIVPLAEMTRNKGHMDSIGGFGCAFRLADAGFAADTSILLAGADGVGTKLLIAQETNIHRTVGIDLVGMCVNDILCHGAKPLLFLDYLAAGKLNLNVSKLVVEGIAEGCLMAGCCLAGGETAEMPGLYRPGVYDLAGFALGAVSSDETRLPRSEDQFKVGDVLIGLPSRGLHSNGFSLVRDLVKARGLSWNEVCPFDPGNSLGKALLTPTKIYVKEVLPVIERKMVKAAAHITGGGIPGNVVRVLPDAFEAELNASAWTISPVFGWVAAVGRVSAAEMLRTFNLGLGMVLVVAAHNQDEATTILRERGGNPVVVGQLKLREPSLPDSGQRVKVTNLIPSLEKAMKPFLPLVMTRQIPRAEDGRTKKRVAVLISGTGTNLQALIDDTREPKHGRHSEIVLVISNKSGVAGITRAEEAGIPVEVVSHQDFKSREEFDQELHRILSWWQIDLVVLAGFMRILSPWFVQQWRGKVLNIHPSLLPAFKGLDAQKQALGAGVRVSGATVHFVDPEVDSGSIIAQEPVRINPVEDSLDDVIERIKGVEHVIFPQALELVASGQVRFNDPASGDD
ncbi:unnamed protein product [Notodromas monacha]|uniref:Trifunctional purine biosynthetic protein adenosine-3 n=1 Tax=Notodromas monacha TaxID=399045 RepID=A0A7R9GDV2_9CRUS|nr:unnamed protein product [Notodromas monacha]CAG0917256.1 unnamed protein product [Notodromas monacha]